MIDVADKDAGLIVAKCFLPITTVGFGERWAFTGYTEVSNVEATVVVDLKNEKIRVAFENVVPLSSYNGIKIGDPIKSSAALHRSMHVDFENLAREMQAAIAKPTDDF